MEQHGSLNINLEIDMWLLVMITLLFNIGNVGQDCEAEKYIFEYISKSLESDIRNQWKSDTIPSIIKDILMEQNIDFEYESGTVQVPTAKIYVSPVLMKPEEITYANKVDTIFRFEGLGTYIKNSNYLMFCSEVIDKEIKIEVLFNRPHYLVSGQGSQYLRHRSQNAGMRYVFKMSEDGCPELISKKYIGYD